MNRPQFLRATVFLVFLSMISVISLAMESAPGSESSFGYFCNDDGERSDLHDRFYTQEEIAIVEEYKAKLSLSRSREKDELIAAELAAQIKRRHGRLFLKDLDDSCCFIVRTSLPDGDDLREIAQHGLLGRKFLCFGRNRTFEVLKNALKWVDDDNNTTLKCPAVFRKIWLEVIAAS